MTAPNAPARMRRRGHQPYDLHQPNSAKARLALALACVWPLVVLFFLSNNNSSAGTETRSNTAKEPVVVVDTSRKLRNFLDRVDILGYGPTHPRVAVVMVGDDREEMVRSVESIFSYTDLNRLFVVCTVMDGVVKDDKLVRRLNEIDAGAVPHWHGLHPDVHRDNQTSEDLHGKKVHALFSKTKQGLTASRSDAVDFIQLLDQKHVQSGLKSPQEDLILLLLQPGAELTSRKWLGPVTSALIVPPPLLHMGKEEDSALAMKLANAISFAVDGPNSDKAMAFDYHLKPQWVDPNAKDMALSNGASFPTAALAGLATAMRLDTYVNLPAQDEAVPNDWLAELDLAMNLWLCADGIDILTDVTVSSPHSPMYNASVEVTPSQAARFAAAWASDEAATVLYNAVLETSPELTQLEWDTMMATASHTPGFPSGLQSKCRPFSWYAREINLSLVVPDEEPAKAKRTTGEKKVEVMDLPDKPLPVPEVKNEPHEGESDNSEQPPPRHDQRLPSIPLTEARLEIIQKAKPVDTTYVDVSGGNTEHPHMGALDEDGKPGYIHDETALRMKPPVYEFDNLEVACKRRDNHYKMLTEKVFVDMKADTEAEKTGQKRDKIFCLVYTIDSGHPKIPAIRETWGPKCDGFMVGSNKTDASIGAVNIVHEGPEEYNNIWQKVRSMWSYIYDHYYEKYDWFHIGGDDLYLLVENLRLYLESEEIRTAANGGVFLPNGDETSQTPLFLGRRFAYMGDTNDIFNSGGSGYTMNKAALKSLVVDGFTNYFPHAHTFSEDTMVARIFRKLGVYPYDTKDETGGERYMPFMPGHHYGYKLPDDPSKDWYAKYSIDIKFGLDHCAARSVAFHYVKGNEMKRLHAILYHLCPGDKAIASE